MRGTFTVLFALLAFNLFAFKASASEPEICSINKISDGSLTVGNGAPVSKLSSSPEFGGVSTKISATCTQAANLSVSAPIQVAGPQIKPVSSFATVTNSAGMSAKSGERELALPPGNTDLTVDLFVDNGVSLTPGEYKFNVQFTFTP
jgi:S-adenosylmethionine hydrolase